MKPWVFKVAGPHNHLATLHDALVMFMQKYIVRKKRREPLSPYRWRRPPLFVLSTKETYSSVNISPEGGMPMHFRYKYKHHDCTYCADLESNLHCPYQHCPYILGNLDDLYHDRAFRRAVRYAKSCDTYHKPALLLDYTWYVEKRSRLDL